MKNLLILLLALITLSCDSENGDERDTSLLPKARGRAGEVIMVIDSAMYNSEVGSALKEVFQAEMEGLPREETLFNINTVQPQQLNDVLRGVKNLVFVMTLDNKSAGNRRVRDFFTQSSIQQIQDNPEMFLYTAEDVYARGQNVIYLFSTTEEKLAEKILENKAQLRDLLNRAENERLKEGLFNAKTAEGLSESLVKNHQFYLKIPFGYKLVEDSEQFVWFRQMNDESDKNIFVTYKSYTSEKQFEKQQIINLRDSIAREKLFEDPELPHTHLITETGVPFIPVVTREVNFNNNYAIEMRGLWRTKTASMGGPFISYTFVDENLGRLYYIEGFLYSPGKAQRELMRELEVILKTFEPRSNSGQQ